MKSPDVWREVMLGQVCQLIGGGTPSRQKTKLFEGDIPWVTPTDVTSLDGLYIEDSSEYISEEALTVSSACLLPAGAVLMTSRATIGRAVIALRPMATNQGFANFVCDEEVLFNEYLAYWLETHKEFLISRAGGTTFKEISKSTLAKIKLPLPPLPEQKRIVEILNQADALRRQRRETLDQAKQLPTALFLEMFGDPRKAKLSWKRKPLQKLVEVRSSLETPNPDTHADALCIGPDSIESATGRLISTPTVKEVQPKSGKYWFEPNDVLFSKIRPNLRKATLAEAQGFCSADMYALICGDEIRPMFLLYLLLSDAFTQFALSRSGRAQQPKLNREQLLSYKVVVPPMDLQKKFEKSIRELKKIVDEMEANTGESDLLQKSLEITAFTGELTASWREAHREELEAWLREHAEQLGKHPVRVKIETIAPPERKQPVRPARRWLMEQLSEIQKQVYLALQEWKGTLIPSADLDEFLNHWPVEHLQDAHDQLRRALDQLAGLGLIAKVSLPTDSGEFVSGYRVLREEELSKPDDLERLGA